MDEKKTISYEKYLATPSLRNQYNDTIAKCHLYNYGCVFVEIILGMADVMEVEYLDEKVKREKINELSVY
ncbi:hypothetical protein IMSAGC017_01947 [Thomasclavelia cocleata]|uniref:Uncharacterized protein n=1 Tax=Thomasclavelia cocleata TaxID=69824 RepID=A0A829ZBV1_9FIRM|nr:hypothetical protein [Thomasclavelia cocleata]GFI41901.1 hypothetical protein IMSAGC017_01947 [Thomasclavelia cocleata]